MGKILVGIDMKLSQLLHFCLVLLGISILLYNKQLDGLGYIRGLSIGTITLGIIIVIKDRYV